LSETVRRCWTPKAPLDAEGRTLYNAEGAAGRRGRRWTPKAPLDAEGARCITPKAPLDAEGRALYNAEGVR